MNMEKNLYNQRREYDQEPIDERLLKDNALEQFQAWFEIAANADVLEPNAMVVATSTPDGHPTQRTVLLKYYDQKGFVFFTNFESRKASQISENCFVSALFLWLPLHRQIEINGIAERIPTSESLKYFSSRPRGSQLGAWVSKQSSIITSRSLLDSKLEEMKQKFLNFEIPLPSFWGGFRIVPHRIEFWQGQTNRLHDRFEYVLQQDGKWNRQRLSP